MGKQTAEYTKWCLWKETIYCCVQQSWILASILYNTLSQNSIYWVFPSLSIFKRQNKSILRNVFGWWECDSLLLLQHVQSPMFSLYHIKTWHVIQEHTGHRDRKPRNCMPILIYTMNLNLGYTKLCLRKPKFLKHSWFPCRRQNIDRRGSVGILQWKIMTLC